MRFSTILKLSVFLALFSTSAWGGVQDQRDPDYQQSLDAVARAQLALQRAQKYLEQSRAVKQLPGVDYPDLFGAIRAMEDDLNLILQPRERRMRYKTITPDGLFFKSPDSQPE